MDDVADRGLRLDPAAARALADGTTGDPFALLGPHRDGDTLIVRAFLPGAQAVELVVGKHTTPLHPVQVDGLFAGRISQASSPRRKPGSSASKTLDAGLRRHDKYLLRVRWPDAVQETEDPYSFGLLLGELDLHLFAEGHHRELGRVFGAQALTVDGVAGVRFAVWAPNARRVSVVGDFNGWDGRRHAMRQRIEAGIWELFVPRLAPGTVYKYELLGPHGLLPLKADPVALQMEPAPRTASVVADPVPFRWSDDEWLQQRAQRQSPHAPLSIYEVHAGSWRRRWDAGRQAPGWDELGEQLIPYVAGLGFTHVELLPITAHPFGGSWGYQPLAQFAPQADWGDPAALKRFVDRCHAAQLGVLVDWVPAHFPTDAHGVAHFDGTALYEHADPREGFHQDWNTLIYNLGRNEVRGFLIASALHWLEQYHVDGLRVDAVASMLYRDYSRRAGEWVPNRYGGRENLESVAFLRQLTDVVRERCPGTLTIAEESTAWPGVTQPTRDGGLGFSYKWNMGWMHDTLQYMARDPIHRAWHHDELTFGLVYAFSEKFLLPLSHDEVVHGKRSLLGRMPGDRWQQFANLRAYYGFMWAHPGKKLLFMGGELGQAREWNHDAELDWPALQDGLHQGVQRVVGALNRLYAAEPALHAADCEATGFRWIVGDDRGNCVYAWYRTAGESSVPILAVSNLTPTPRHGYRVGAPRAGVWREVLNTDDVGFGGSGVANAGVLQAASPASHGQPFSLELTLPPLATIWLRADG